MSEPLRRFFQDDIAGVLDGLARKYDAAGAGYARAKPELPFEGNLPSQLAWSQAWSVAVAGVYLDSLQRRAKGGIAGILRHIWSHRFDNVRFRAGPRLTALPTHAKWLHLDLWTCGVKAQALAFDAARWSACAGGRRWHAVRVDMHDLCGLQTVTAADSAVPLVQAGLGVELVYQCAFIDRLHAALDARTAAVEAHRPGDVRSKVERTIAIDMDAPTGGHLPNLKLLLRWRSPPGAAQRFVDDGDPATHLTTTEREALNRMLAAYGEAPPAHALDSRRVDWQPHPSAPCLVDAMGTAFIALGHADIWDAVGPDVQWVDLALAVHVHGRWHELPIVEVPRLEQDRGESTMRSTLLLAGNTPLPDGLDLDTLRAAAASSDCVRWVAHEDGLGAFVMGAVDVDAWRRTRAR